MSRTSDLVDSHIYLSSNQAVTKYVDLQEIINERESVFLKRLPRFIVRLLEKIIHQDEINTLLKKYEGCNGQDFIWKMISELNINLKVEGEENLPAQSRCFIVANHPFGIADGLAITSIASKKYGGFKSIGNDVYYYIPNLRDNIVAVNVFGKSNREYILKALDELKSSDAPVTHFPAGLVSRLQKGRVRDKPWHKSLISRSISTERLVVPVYFHGRNSLLFYSLFLIRKLFRLPLNIELILLPHEFFRKRNKTIRARIGKPIHWQRFDASLTHYQWAQKVREYVYKMGKTKGDPPPF